MLYNRLQNRQWFPCNEWSSPAFKAAKIVIVHDIEDVIVLRALQRFKWVEGEPP